MYNPGDPLFNSDIRQTTPNFGFGIYYYTDKYYAGISAPNLMYNVFERGQDFETITQTNPIMFMGGYVFSLSRVVKLKPNFLVKLLDDKLVEIPGDLSAKFVIGLLAG